MIRVSISSIPYPSHLNLSIDGQRIPFNLYPESIGQKDRAWVEIHLEKGGIPGLTSTKAGTAHTLRVELTKEGEEEEEGQGGKMITSIEVIEYGTPDK